MVKAERKFEFHMFNTQCVQYVLLCRTLLYQFYLFYFTFHGLQKVTYLHFDTPDDQSVPRLMPGWYDNLLRNQIPLIYFQY